MTDNIVYIGRKPVMNYVLAVMRAFTQLGADSVVLKARGQAISRAVDVAEVTRRRFLDNISPAGIEIGSEQMPTPDGGTRGVSTIAISLTMTGRPEPEVPAVTPLDVSEVKGIGGARAEKLKSAGYGTVESLAEAEPGRLSELTGISEKLTAKFIESAKELLEQR